LDILVKTQDKQWMISSLLWDCKKGQPGKIMEEKKSFQLTSLQKSEAILYCM
jgi:hypothetical protein